jgi:hypothetical protein
MERLFRRKRFDMVGEDGCMIAFLAFSGVLGKGRDIKPASAQHNTGIPFGCISHHTIRGVRRKVRH